MVCLNKYISLIEESNTKETVWETIKFIGLDYQKTVDILYRKNSGIFYTGLDLAEYISKKLIDYIKASNKDIYSLRLLEPCVGIGNFIFSYLRILSQTNTETSNIKKIIDNIYVCDIDRQALGIYKNIFEKFVYVYFGIRIHKNYWTEHLKNELSFNISAEECKYISYDSVFSSIADKFDIIITNPPYKNLKANENNYSDINDYIRDKSIYKIISEYVKKHFSYANEGVLNMYKIFVEDILCQYTKNDAIVSLLIPSTIISDKTCSKLRNFILNENKLVSITEVNENDKNIDAQQSMVSLLIHKGEKTSRIGIDNIKNNEEHTIDYNNIKELPLANYLCKLSESEISILKKIYQFPKIKDLDFIDNKRGELDLTANKKYITKQQTPYKLIRGKNLAFYKLKEEQNEYVLSEFVQISTKNHFIKQDRIACQQISNINCDRRLKFIYLKKNYVLANSCNFISISKNKYNIDIYTLLGILNSSLLNWYFKLISSNNHINNYEIDEFPIPIGYSRINEIGLMVKEYLEFGDDNILLNIDKMVNEAFGLNEEKKEISSFIFARDKDLFSIISTMKCDIQIKNEEDLESFCMDNNIQLNSRDKELIKNIFIKYKKLEKNILLNHITFKLSDLDMEMIINIPQGGNWKNIPDDVISKSERLKKIKQSGGRTTLYGRIDYNKPSYTITTYFNRPGNGTYVHPVHNRVISVREAARFQSFCDDYYFIGNKSDMLKQVGNAVPPLLAYQIAKQIASKLSVNTCLDLFCGAGGMSQGFKHAGFSTVMGVDFDQSACMTYKVNNPEVEVLCEDLTKSDVKNYIINRAKEQKVDLICGGPPCQGFSMAGKRFIDDPRNQLFKEYLHLVENIKPKVFVFENVEGLLTFQNGEIYKQILDEFSKIGYNIAARMLKASDYAVPQKRKRIIIIGIKNDINVIPEACFPKKIELDDDIISARNAIGDIETIPCSEDALYINTSSSLYIKMLRKEISFEEFLDKIRQKSKIGNIESSKQLSLFAA